MFSIDGLISGLNTSQIIDSLVALQENQVQRLNVKKAKITQQQTAFKSIEARLTTLRSTMSRLNRSTSNVFQSRQASSSDESMVTAAASSSAQTGIYSISVNSLAKAHQIASTGFASSSTAITHGEFIIQVGEQEAQTITIDDTNDTVNGLLNSINSQLQDVKATTILDQASGTYRLMLTSKNTGTDNEITITNNLAAASGNAVRPDFSGQAVQEAANASVSIGSGPGAITAEYQSNRVDGLLDGVTLNLSAADPAKTITISVEQNNDSIVDAVKSFVDEFNAIVGLIADQTKYVAETQQGGPLLGNRSAIEIQNRLRGFVADTIPGLSSQLNRMSRIGVDFTDQGTLTFDAAQLTKALNGELPGVSITEVNRLFGMTATTSNSNVEFLLGSSRTKATSQPIQVDITQAAEQARATATNTLSSSTVIDSSNNQLEISVDGSAPVTLSLASGTYTQQELADHLQSVINSSPELGNRRVAVEVNNDQISIQSESYGTASKIEELGGSALAALGFSGDESAEGKDVVGRFLVNGEIETAVGRGRVLSGESSNATTADLQVRISLRPDQVLAGNEAELSISRGVTSRIDEYIGNILDPSKGTLNTLDEGFNSQIESFDASIARVRAIAEAKRDSLIIQFAALERSLADMQATSGFLGQQLSSLSGAKR